jgi:hypothetical protein
MDKIVRLRDWILQRMERMPILSPEKVDKLYRHYHRMRDWETEVFESEGPRSCPERRV